MIPTLLVYHGCIPLCTSYASFSSLSKTLSLSPCFEEADEAAENMELARLAAKTLEERSSSRLIKAIAVQQKALLRGFLVSP